MYIYFNIVLCLWGLIVSLKHKRLISFMWLLSFYFSIAILVNGVDTVIIHDAKFSGARWLISEDSQKNNVIFVLMFNCALAVGELFFLKFYKFELPRLKTANIQFRKILNIFRLSYGVALIASSFLYYLKMRGLGYTDYVEFKDSNWPFVFLFAASPFVTFSYVLGKKISIIVSLFIFIFFAFYLNVRSFLLISILPLLFCFIIKNFQISENFNYGNFTRYIKYVFLFLIFIFLGSFLGYQRTGMITLPEFGLPVGMHIIMDKFRAGYDCTGFNSLLVFMYGLLMPIYKIFDLQPPFVHDTPAIFAAIYEGFESKPTNYYHYPVLWYADAYASFRSYGILMGFFWGAFLVTYERLISISMLTFLIFIPFYSWTVYFLVRGAVGNSINSISYPLFLSFIVFIIFQIIIKFKRVDCSNV